MSLCWSLFSNKDFRLNDTCKRYTLDKKDLNVTSLYILFSSVFGEFDRKIILFLLLFSDKDQ